MSGTAQQRILIVDDNITNLKVAVENLKAHGLEILTARSGEVGLERASFARPDLILLDVGLPGIDGFEACRRLKANASTQDIPVIFMTALNDVEDKLKGFAAGGVDYVTKPVQVEELWARVNSHLTIRALQTELEDKIAGLNAFAHTVAHDLKSPLTQLIGGLELLRETAGAKLDEEAQHFIHFSIRGGRKLAAIVDDLLLLASVHQQDVLMERLDMAAIIAQTCGRLAHQIKEQQAHLFIPGEWPLAQGYAPWIEEIWANYLSNGLKYGGRPPHLQLGSTLQADGMVRFWLRDNGPGLSPEDSARLFQQFTRLRRNEAEGHGLGLSIVRRIAEKLGGSAGVESSLGSGSTFYFTLPAVGSI
jgi:two-component system, sensor histidine kinase and response regulator